MLKRFIVFVFIFFSVNANAITLNEFSEKLIETHPFFIQLSLSEKTSLLEQNRKVLRSAGVVVYLSSSVEQLLRRTAKSKTRPLLENNLDRKKTITEIVNARDKYYREVSTIVVDTTGKKLNEVIDIIMNDL